MRQMWSSQIPWKGTDVRGIGLWASTFGATSSYSFTIDNIELY